MSGHDTVTAHPDTPGRSAATERLVLSHFTLHLDHPLDDRIRAAGAAGFSGIGLYAGQWAKLLDNGWSVARLRELLDDAGVTIAEVEALSGWGAASPTESYLAFEDVVWGLVAEFDVPYVQAIGPVEGSFDEAAPRFGALCDRAAGYGATVGLEFLPFTNVVDAADARSIVEGADRSNGGVCVDIWHHVRGANDLGLLRSLPPELVVAIQMSDGPSTPTLSDYKDDCLRHRQPPGDGDFDVDGFVSTMLASGVDVAWDLEVCNDDVWGHPGADHVQACADGMRRVLARCLAPPPDPPSSAPGSPAGSSDESSSS